MFLLAAGFSPEFTGALAVIQFVLGIFLHANVRWRLRWLHRVMITPEFHHWHHANEPGAINANYSVFLPAWDLLFGTYFMPRHRRPGVYGISEYMPAGMAAQLWHPLRGMGNPLRALRHPFRSLRALLRGLRALVGDLWRSARRPRRRSHDDVAPGLGQPMATAHLALPMAGPDDPAVRPAGPPPPPPPPGPATPRPPSAVPPPPGPASAVLPPPVGQAAVAPPVLPAAVPGGRVEPTTVATGLAPTVPYSPYFPHPVAPDRSAAATVPGGSVPAPTPTSLAQVMGWDATDLHR